MALIDPTDTIVAQLTTEARKLLARKALNLVTFKFDGFAVGRGGYRTSTTTPTGDPNQILDINPEHTALLDPVFPTTYYFTVSGLAAVS